METSLQNYSTCLGLNTKPERNKKTPQHSVSPFRYHGGKTRAVELILPYFPLGIKSVCCPFLGGGSIELALANKGIQVYASDKDTELINCWEELLSQPDKLANRLENLHPLERAKFYSLKRDYHKLTNKQEQAAAFLAINRCSFNGGVFTSGYSGNKRFTQPIIERVAQFKAPNLYIYQADFKDAIALHHSDFLYLDPPYPGKENLYSSSSSGFDHQGLSAILKKRGNWLLSYSDCPEVRELYTDYAIVPLQWAYGMSKNKKSNEILIFSKDLRHKSNGTFSYYGSKSKIAKHYPEPIYDTIIEPFAGAAVYSELYRYKNVILNEKDDVIHGIWNFLINEATPELLVANKDFNLGDDIRKFNLQPKALRDLIGFCINRGCARPGNTVTKWSCQSKKKSLWASTTASRLVNIAGLLPEITHWKTIHGDYHDLPDIEATWFIDPPYQHGGQYYRENKIDYQELAAWCMSRKGQVIVCENSKADWLHFKPLISITGQRHKTIEAVFVTNKTNK